MLKRVGPLRTLPRRIQRAAYLRLYRRFRPRRFHAYGVGLLKSGTHSIAGLFFSRYRSRHEPAVPQLVRSSLALAEGRMTETAFRELVLRRDRTLWLEMDSSAFNVHQLRFLVEAFPDARFVLTIRDCMSWVESAFDHKLGRAVPEYLQAFLRHWFRADLDYRPHDRPLEDRGLFPLAVYFRAWARHNEEVIATVPASRLLVVRTDRILQSQDSLADFLGIPATTLDGTRGHSFAAPRRFGLLSQLDPAYVGATAAHWCDPLMRSYFPDRRLDDAV